jgi:hypothetical protein
MSDQPPASVAALKRYTIGVSEGGLLIVATPDKAGKWVLFAAVEDLIGRLPVEPEHLKAAFDAGFHWAMDGHDKYGEYLGGPIEDGFELFVKSWAGVSLPVDPQESDQ